MTVHNDVIVGIEFLVRARWDVAHWDVRAALNASDFALPWLANVEKFDVACLFHFFRCDFPIHKKPVVSR
jgi:hypothetical protein